MQPKKPNTALIGIISLVILGLAVGGTIFFKKDSTENTSTATTSTPSTASDTPSTASSSGSSFKSGTYTASGSYTSPGGEESIEVTITLDGNTIRDTSAKTDAASTESREYQAEFTSNYKSLVVGKDINSVKLSKVAGSSLTSRGFNDALAEIRQKAKS